MLAVIGKCVDKEPEPEPEPPATAWDRMCDHARGVSCGNLRPVAREDSRGRAGGSYCIHTSLESAASWMHELYVGKTFRTTGRVC